MTFKEIQDLIRLVGKSNLTEFKMKDKDFELSIRTKKYNKGGNKLVSAAPVMSMAPTAAPAAAPVANASSATPPPAAAAAKEEGGSNEADLIAVKSPIVGTFYRSSDPEKPPFTKVGDSIEVGTVVCIVEAMKLFNEIESEISGKIVKVLVEDASPVEYDQPLFLVDPKG